jgi:two-component system OmpR family response regulator
MRVLVVEDDLRMASLLRRGLEEEGHVVDVETTGESGLWLGTEQPFDAVVLDVMLPDLDGFEVCRRLRAAGRWMPVLLLTARTEVADRIEGLDTGADDYLMKPFSFGELLARLRALVRRGSNERPVLLTAGDLELDPATRRVARGAIEIVLSAKEFALLELFMRRPNEVLTRTTIIDQCWDFAYDGTSNVVDQYVRYLRDKIDRPFNRNDLETIRGAGYRLRAPVHHG